jgi:hypothetical protein
VNGKESHLKGTGRHLNAVDSSTEEQSMIGGIIQCIIQTPAQRRKENPGDEGSSCTVLSRMNDAMRGGDGGS